jgi:hypothetical protein
MMNNAERAKLIRYTISVLGMNVTEFARAICTEKKEVQAWSDGVKTIPALIEPLCKAYLYYAEQTRYGNAEVAKMLDYEIQMNGQVKDIRPFKLRRNPEPTGIKKRRAPKYNKLVFKDQAQKRLDKPNFTTTEREKTCQHEQTTK